VLQLLDAITAITPHSSTFRDSAYRSAIRPSQLKSGIAQAQASQSRFIDSVAAPSTPNFFVEADGIVPSAARLPTRAPSLGGGGGAAGR
jgi:hypothetical protein